ncbi:MAG: ribosome biogenesis GTPase Der [Spirochaetia bacterium]|jgi:GTP-binding protein|nr:ribosome biogenesis GTPase Der [Spirochaetia bacterium]
MGKKEKTEAVPDQSSAEPVQTLLRYENLPLVALVGRPNVGKSTLFNRLLHKRRTITDPRPGVTRDPIEAELLMPDGRSRCRLVDTGGFKLEREGLDDLVVARSLSVLSRADLVLFIVDATDICPEDEEFAALLRPMSQRLILVVNKADSPERDTQAWSHLRWGYDEVVFISAEHSRNIDLLLEKMRKRLDFSKTRAVDVERADIRIAIMGKPNTGKSSLLNILLGEERSIVSDIPGTTRDVVEGRFTWKGRGIVVLDTAGIRRKKKVHDDVEYYSVTRSIAVVSQADIVILMIDAQEGLTEQDKKIAAFAVEEGRGVVFALSKWDLMPEIKNSFEASRDKLRFFFGQMAYAPVVAISAKEASGLDKLMNTVISVYSMLNRKIETSKLNKAFSEWVESNPPPVGSSTRFKLRYAVQTSVNPQKFSVFVTKPEVVPDSYVSFLKNKIRKEFGLDGIPVSLNLKASRRDWNARKKS